MYPNPNSPDFLRHEIPDYASSEALKLSNVFDLIKADIWACKWHNTKSDCLSLEYNTYDGRVCFKVYFTDQNNHTHTFAITYLGFGKRVLCNYLFEGSIGGPSLTFRSYAEWLMLQMWKLGIDVELEHCSRGLSVTTPIDEAYNVFTQMLNIVDNNIKPIDWFLSKEKIWHFKWTYMKLNELLPHIKDEAAKGRWKDIKPQNFRLIRGEDYAYIDLEYTDDTNYIMYFRVGMSKESFAFNSIGTHMTLEYYFKNISKDRRSRSYFKKENKKFIKFANIMLEITFSWETLFIRSEDDFSIICSIESVFQKFCLMLDFIIPYKDQYQATNPYLTPEQYNAKKKLESSLSTKLKLSEKQAPELIFTYGHFFEEHIAQESKPNEDLPF